MKKILWTIGFEAKGLLLDPTEDTITKYIIIGDDIWIGIKGIPVSEEDNLNKLLNEKNPDFDNGDLDCVLENFLTDCGYAGEVVAIEEENGCAQVAEMLAYSKNENQFFRLDQCEETPAYDYWDGSNWKTKFFDEALEYEYVIETGKSKNLDEWDCNNWSCGGKFAHALLHTIEKLDDNEVSETWLLETWTQYQGDTTGGQLICGLESLKKCLAELGRSYMFEEVI
jgi:hypothetical protein